jgi:hypothetical protein
MPSLKQLAAGLRTALEWAQQAGKPRSWMMRTLPNGLQIVYSYDGDQWRLALRREKVYPADVEVATIRRDFDVPENAGENSYTRTEEQPATGRKAKYCVVELTWREQIPCQNDGAIGGRKHLPLAASTYAPVEGSDAAVWGG